MWYTFLWKIYASDGGCRNGFIHRTDGNFRNWFISGTAGRRKNACQNWNCALSPVGGPHGTKLQAARRPRASALRPAQASRGQLADQPPMSCGSSRVVQLSGRSSVARRLRRCPGYLNRLPLSNRHPAAVWHCPEDSNRLPFGALRT